MLIDRTLARPKRPSEEFRLSWDFVDDLESGDTISGQEVKAFELPAGTDVSVTLLDGPTLSGTEVSVQIQAGTDGKDYAIRFQATSAAGDKWQRVVLVPVRA